MPQLFQDFKANLLAGLRLVFFRPCDLSQFRFSLDQLALLLLLDLILSNLASYAQVLPNPEFDIYALSVYCFDEVSFFAIAYLLTKLFAGNATLLQLGVVINSIAPLSILLIFISIFPDKHPDIVSADSSYWLSIVMTILAVSIFYRALSLLFTRRKLPILFSLVLFSILSGISYFYYHDHHEFWYREVKPEEDERQDPYAPFRTIDAEALMYRQAKLLDNALSALSSVHKQPTDLFFVGFAGYAMEDVFSKEVFYAQRLFDERFDTKGHSISLINHLTTLNEIPLATATNLALTLKRIGQLMKPDDILFLYLTSHGSENHQLSVSLWPLALNDITPEKLKEMLDNAGIKWRIVIVSSCYSGGFISPLQGPATLVATASAADKTSFGCGNEFDFTYFGEALFKQQLQQQTSFVAALKAAATSIEDRELREKITSSEPQLSVGADMAGRLNLLDRQLKQQLCHAEKPQFADC